MITSSVNISLSKRISDTLFLLDLAIEKFHPWIPGMFLQLSLHQKSGSEPWLDSRAFSIASWGKPEAKLLVRMEGNFTRELIDRAKNGFQTSMRYPFGSFLLNSHDSKVFLSAGAGVSVFLSYIDYIKTNNIGEEVIMFHQVRRNEEALRRIYWDDLPDNFLIRQYVSNERSGEHKFGRFSLLDLNKELARPLEKYVFYICGPPSFSVEWSRILGSKGLKVKAESWTNAGGM